MRILFLMLFLLTGLVFASHSSDFVHIQQQEQQIILKIKPRHFIAYDHLHLSGAENADQWRPEPQTYSLKTEPLVGYQNTIHIFHPKANKLTVNYQVCHESGTCYPPSTHAPSPLSFLMILFVMGFTTASSGCLLPMVPLISHQLQSNHPLKNSAWFIAAIGTALTLSLLTSIAIGHYLPLWWQTPTVHMITAGILIGLAAHLMRPEWIQLPSTVPFPKSIHPFIAGFTTTFILSPCALPSLSAGIALASTKTPTMTGLGLLLFFTGLTIPLMGFILVGKRFMNVPLTIQRIIPSLLAVSILAVSFYLLNLAAVTPFTYSLTVALIALVFGLALRNKHSEPVSFFCLFFMAAWFFFPRQAPELESSSHSSTEQQAIFITAKWCHSCQLMKKNQTMVVLKNDPHWKFIEKDISSPSPQDVLLLKTYNLQAPPALILRDRQHFIYQDGYMDKKQIVDLIEIFNSTPSKAFS